MTDKYLDHLWSLACRALKGETCANPECNNMAGGIHHIIKRRYRVLRWDVKNGMPLCGICHPIADRNTAFALAMLSQEDQDYLAKMGVYTLAEWLQINHLTRDEWHGTISKRLRDIIKGEV